MTALVVGYPEQYAISNEHNLDELLSGGTSHGSGRECTHPRVIASGTYQQPPFIRQVEHSKLTILIGKRPDDEGLGAYPHESSKARYDDAENNGHNDRPIQIRRVLKVGNDSWRSSSGRSGE
ncbi:MAG: hypothetical protein Q9186_004556 [Xanthomendoza sp. 1 TL-2023]